MSPHFSSTLSLLLVLCTVATIFPVLVIFVPVTIIVAFDVIICLKNITIGATERTALIDHNAELADPAVVQADMPVIQMPALAQENVPPLFKSLHGIPPVDLDPEIDD